MDQQNRVTYSQIVAKVASKTGFSENAVRAMSKALVEEIVDQTLAGNTVTWHGFGHFYVLENKGHPIGFTTEGHRGDVANHFVFKFSAAHSMNVKVRAEMAKRV